MPLHEEATVIPFADGPCIHGAQKHLLFLALLLLSLAFCGNYIYLRKAVDRHIQLVDVSLLDADEAGEPARDLGRST
jgi:hypothetical protein